MSIIKVNKLIAASDSNFQIDMPSTAHLNIRGGFAIDEDSGLKLPVGTTAQRPGTPTAGMIRYNSTEGNVEGYNGTGWVNLMVPESAAGGSGNVTTGVPKEGLVIWLDANNENSLKADSGSQDANYWYNLTGENYHFSIPTDRYATETINGEDVRYMDFRDNGSGCAKFSHANFIDTPYFPAVSVVFFMKWRTSNGQWRTPLRSRDADHHIIVQDGTRNLGMYDNNGAGFQDSGYNIDQFPNWDTKFNMYTWRLSNFTSGVYSPCYQCYFHGEQNARATNNSGNARFNRGFHSVGAYHSGNRNPHSSSQNAGAIAVFMYYNRHITQTERQQIYDHYKDTFDI